MDHPFSCPIRSCHHRCHHPNRYISARVLDRDHEQADFTGTDHGGLHMLFYCAMALRMSSSMIHVTKTCRLGILSSTEARYHSDHFSLSFPVVVLAQEVVAILKTDVALIGSRTASGPMMEEVSSQSPAQHIDAPQPVFFECDVYGPEH